jgi:hypothetical protein
LFSAVAEVWREDLPLNREMKGISKNEERR